MPLAAAALFPIAAAAGGTFVARVPGSAAPLLRELAALPCEECARDDGLVDMWKPDGIAAAQVPDRWRGDVEVRGGAALRRALNATPHELVHADFDAAVAAERARTAALVGGIAVRGGVGGPPDKDVWHTDYHTYDDVNAKLREWVNAYSAVTEFTMGRSYAGKEINGIRFGASPQRHAVWVQCGIHAREWIAPATCMYFAQKMLDGLASGEAEITRLLAQTYVYLVPVLNVDGYEFTWSDNRMWRKNRQPNQGSSAVGTDLNRNWDADWGQCGASTNPSSDTYRGANVFSAPETEAVRSYITGLKADGYHMLGGHDFHAHGQLLLRSYGWTNQNAPNNAQEEARGAKMVDAIQASSGLRYVNQRAYDLYCCSGLACDWLAEQTTEYSGFTFELRGTPGGFILPPDQIVSSGEEIYAAMVVWLQEVTYTKLGNATHA